MLIVGAGGFAKEIFEIFQQRNMLDNIVFYDDVNDNAPAALFNHYPVLKNETAAASFFQNTGNDFTIAIGNPFLRHKLLKKFSTLGGKLTSVISAKANIGSHEVQIGEGCNILDGAVFSNCTSIGTGCIVYYNAVITHDSHVGNFVQVSPNVNILGASIINDFTFIGAGATILPKIKIGRYAVIGAGAVVTKNVLNHALVVGNPARQTGWVSRMGQKLSFDKNNNAFCTITGEKYTLKNNTLEIILNKD